MKVSRSWLDEWARAPWNARELGSRLTMAGFEVEGLEPAAPEFTGVVVAEILDAVRHPQADKLQVCRVSTGQGEPVQIVCGAANARAGLRTALATVGAMLPGDLKIKAAKLRGVESFGMLCSAKELGLADTSSGILELPADAPVGTAIREYLALDDHILELNVTPNRGDAMSVLGVAREVAAITGSKLAGPALVAVPAAHRDTFPVALAAPAACPRFAGRLIRGVDPGAPTPLWMKERLRRAGVRSISAVVDVTNYVLLELGQPMHAYDHAKLQGAITVRLASADEKLTLLDGRGIDLADDVLVIADAGEAIALAGVMGGERTAVSDGTRDVFLEVAYFAPGAIAGRARRYGLQTDASQRFERGVDPAGQERAIERATQLITAIAGGSAGPVVVTRDAASEPRRAPVPLRRAQLARLLGTDVPDERVVATLASLDMAVEHVEGGWRVTPPSWRFDIVVEPDLIEEVARIFGYDAIPEANAIAPQRFRRLPEEAPVERIVLETLAARGYLEAITLAFVDPALQRQLFPDVAGLSLTNPIASDLAVMRCSLWPGLLRTALENQRRQQDRIRLIEHGVVFLQQGGALAEVDRIAGVAVGPRLPEQWGLGAEQKAAVDFYDVKADVEALLAGTASAGSFQFEAASLACLHPGRSARIVREGAPIGWLGELHPQLVRELDFTHSPVLFELDFVAALSVRMPTYREISRFPHVRRDLAVVVSEDVSLNALRERVTLASQSLLRELRVFDIYRGQGVETGRKSVALGLIFQDNLRTLTDEDVTRAVAAIVEDLRSSLGARVRE